MFSKHSQRLKVLMMLTVSMTVSHLCQNLEIVKGVRSLTQASEGVNRDRWILSRGSLRVRHFVNTKWCARLTLSHFDRKT